MIEKINQLREYLDDLYIQFICSPVGYKLTFWGDQGSFLCWLLGHDKHYFTDGNCKRCNMGTGYFEENREFLKRRGLFLQWRVMIYQAKLLAWLTGIDFDNYLVRIVL